MLNERRSRILDLVAESYISSAHPVPSSQVAERLNVSSATIRNEFSELEESGYLQQPHTSAGRIPTSRGFRAYTRALLPPEGPEPSQLRLIQDRLNGKHGDTLLETIALLAADLSGYAVVVRLPADETLHAIEIHLSALSASKLLAVVVLENGLVRQLVVDLDPTPSADVITGAESSLRQLTVPVGEMPRALAALAQREVADLARTLTALAEAWPAMNPPRLFSGGLRNLLSEPESRDPEFLRLVVEQVETPGEDSIDGGLELSLDDSTARIRARLELGRGYAGLTVVGPARMRYREALRVACGIADTLAPGSAGVSTN
ncbi:MAG: DeoR family transcriptional regulator [Trueperaceae bacterium]